jgi:hypothetical protein
MRVTKDLTSVTGTECQNRKIRCDLAQSSSSSCTRCIKKGLKCTLNKSLQSILVDEAEWKMGMQNTSQQLQAAVSEILGVLNLPPLETFASPGSQPVSNVQRGVRFGSIASTSQVDGTSPLENMRSATPRTMAMTRENSNEPEHSHEGSGTLVGAPINTLYEVGLTFSLFAVVACRIISSISIIEHGPLFVPKMSFSQESTIAQAV